MLKLPVAMDAGAPDLSRLCPLAQFALKRRSECEGGRQVGKISFIDLAGSERGADTYDNDRRDPLVTLRMLRTMHVKCAGDRQLFAGHHLGVCRKKRSMLIIYVGKLADRDPMASLDCRHTVLIGLSWRPQAHRHV